MLATPLFAGCARNLPQTPTAVTNASPAPVVALPRDDLGREIKLNGVPRRVISLAPGVTETIYALGAGGRLVGRDQMSDYPAAARQLPQVADFNGPFFEKVVALRPDFIIEQGETYDAGRIELWQRKCGVPVALLQPKSVKEVQSGIEKIAAWLGVPQKAAALTREFHLVGRDSRRGQSFVRWPAFIEIGRSPLWSAGDDTLIGDVLSSAGLGNVAKIHGYKPFSAESLVQADPEFYVVTDAKPDVQRALRELRAVPALRGLKCIQKGRVIVVPADWVLRPGPRLAKGIGEITRQLSQIERRDSALPGVLKP